MTDQEQLITPERISPGVISYQDIPKKIESASLDDVIDFLKEDLFQAVYPNQVLIDIGWYPSFDKTGAFQISIIKNSDWATPVYFQEAKSVSRLLCLLDHAVDVCSRDLD
jgi:hypothetical protein